MAQLKPVKKAIFIYIFYLHTVAMSDSDQLTVLITPVRMCSSPVARIQALAYLFDCWVTY